MKPNTFRANSKVFRKALEQGANFTVGFYSLLDEAGCKAAWPGCQVEDWSSPLEHLAVRVSITREEALNFIAGGQVSTPHWNKGSPGERGYWRAYMKDFLPMMFDGPDPLSIEAELAARKEARRIQRACSKAEPARRSSLRM